MVKLDGYELIIGSSLDPQFGPVLLFGTGGQLVEVFKDRALGLPPLNTTLARRMMEQTKILTALRGVRGRRPGRSGRARAASGPLQRSGRRTTMDQGDRHQPTAGFTRSPAGARRAGDRTRVPTSATRKSPGRPSVRIRRQYITAWTAKDGSKLVLRPIRPEDEPSLVKFHGTLSERTVSLRYFHAMTLSARVAHERLTRICFIDYDREMALVAEPSRSHRPATRKSSASAG